MYMQPQQYAQQHLNNDLARVQQQCSYPRPPTMGPWSDNKNTLATAGHPTDTLLKPVEWPASGQLGNVKTVPSGHGTRTRTKGMPSVFEEPMILPLVKRRRPGSRVNVSTKSTSWPSCSANNNSVRLDKLGAEREKYIYLNPWGS